MQKEKPFEIGESVYTSAPLEDGTFSVIRAEVVGFERGRVLLKLKEEPGLPPPEWRFGREAVIRHPAEIRREAESLWADVIEGLEATIEYGRSRLAGVLKNKQSFGKG